MDEVQTTPWIDKIYVAERMPAPMAMGDESKIEISDKDIDAIEYALDISTADAVKALQRSKGDVSTAFESEIGRLKLNTQELNNLVLEYAGYRQLPFHLSHRPPHLCSFRGLLQLSESESEEIDAKEEFHDSKSDTEMMTGSEPEVWLMM